MTTSAIPVEASLEAQQHPHWMLVIRVCNSQCFHSAARLRDFLIYVADCALRNCAEEATEQHIGMHVFQRSPGYNSSEDSIVRTHARLLRQKLADAGVIDAIGSEHVYPTVRAAVDAVSGPEQPAPAPAATSR